MGYLLCQQLLVGQAGIRLPVSRREGIDTARLVISRTVNN